MLYVSEENLLQGQQETRTTGYGILDSGNQPSAKSVYGIFGESLWDSRYRLQDEEHIFTETISSLKDEQLKYKKQFTSLKGEQQNHADLKVLGTKSATKDKRTVIQEERTIRDRVEEFIRINQTEQKHKYRKRLQINSDFFKSFGEISFSAHRQGQNQEPAYYTVLKGNTDPDHAFKFLTQVWRIPPPKVLLSILGGAKTLVLKNKDIQKIKKGLIKATSSTGAWIVTGGTHSGVMKIVGEAVQEHMSKDNKGNIIVPLGIAPLGKIRGNNELSGNITTEQGGKSSSNNLTDRSTGVPLDPNHSHFVFVDKETSSFGSETEFRFSLEKQISKFKFYQNRASPPEGINIPVVKIIIGGGLRTLKAVKISLEDLIPLLVIDGSGRAANFISRATELYETRVEDKQASLHEEARTCLRSDLVTKKLKEFATKAFGATGVKEAMDHLHDIMKTSNKSLIRVFSLEETKRTLNSVLQEILFPAFFKGLEKRVPEDEILNRKLELVAAWKRSDIAEEEIFRALGKNPLPVLKMYDIFLSSLKDDRQDFVELILDYVTNLKDILYEESATNNENKYAKIVNDLYKHRINPKNGSSAGQLIFQKMLALEQGFCKNPSFHTFEDFERQKPDKSLGRIYTLVKALFDDRDIYSFEDLSDLETHIFIWAIMMNNKDMAMIFWHRGTNYICTALIASCLLKSLSDIAYTEAYMELGTSYGEHSRYFETLAFNVLDKLYSKNRSVCQELLVTKVKKYGFTTPFALAELKALKKFTGHTACQTTLNIIWKGDILTYTHTLKIFATFWFPVIASRYMTNKTRASPIHNKVGTTSNQNDNTKNPMMALCCCNNHCSPKDILGFLSTLKAFYSAPISKFIGNIVSYLVFLTIFSLMVLTDLNTMSEEGPSVLEIVTWIWITTMIIEEMRQIHLEHPISIKYKLYGWISDAWNLYDCIMYILFVTSFLLRFLLSVEDFFYARLAYTVTLGMYILRSMQFLLMIRIIGPKVIMIGRMTKDILFFIILFALFVFTFGVMYQAILFPNSRPSWQLFKDIIYYPYWQLYGELFLETIEGKETAGCTSIPALYLNGTMARCAKSNSMNSLLLAVYLILTNILLINILIVMFS